MHLKLNLIEKDKELRAKFGITCLPMSFDDCVSQILALFEEVIDEERIFRIIEKRLCTERKERHIACDVIGCDFCLERFSELAKAIATELRKRLSDV